jgi:DNA-binding NtrC family response regulator
MGGRRNQQRSGGPQNLPDSIGSMVQVWWHMRCLKASAVDSFRLHVLIVDDDDDWRAIAADVLAEAGFHVTTATDGRAGLAAWQRDGAPVVVTDCDMPIMDGCHLLAAVHSIDRNVPIIILTANDISDAPSRFLGAFRVIQKPVPTEVLVSAVTDAFLCGRAPRGRRIVNAARAAMSSSRVRGHAALSRVARFLRPRTDTDQRVVVKRRRGARARLAMAAGFGAALAAVLIAAMRGSAV